MCKNGMSTLLKYIGRQHFFKSSLWLAHETLRTLRRGECWGEGGPWLTAAKWAVWHTHTHGRDTVFRYQMFRRYNVMYYHKRWDRRERERWEIRTGSVCVEKEVDLFFFRGKIQYD